MPVDVDAVLFWKVFDPEKAALAVADYASAVGWASQTALRDVIGKTLLADLLEGRTKISNELQQIIDARTEPWGVNVISVEVRDVLIPQALEDAMSMQAQAERERQARVILGDSERQVAEKFGEAAKTYTHDPVALHLRAMSMLYEGLKENATPDDALRGNEPRVALHPAADARRTEPEVHGFRERDSTKMDRLGGHGFARRDDMVTFARELGVRAAVAAVALPIVGTALWLGGGYAAALFALSGAIAAYEYYRLTPLRAASVRWIGIAAAAGLCGLPLIAADGWASIALVIVVTASMATWACFLAYGPRPEAPASVGHLLAGVAFVAGGLIALAVLRARPDGLAWSAIVLATAWGNDTGAFLGGKLLGNRLLLPAVSPGKTREGLAIGAVVGIAAAIATQLGFDTITRDDAIMVGIIAAVLGPIGDLSKSMLKRAGGAKDSGKLFLAHGGMLDRIDAVLFDAVGVLGYVTLVHR